MQLQTLAGAHAVSRMIIIVLEGENKIIICDLFQVIDKLSIHIVDEVMSYVTTCTYYGILLRPYNRVIRYIINDNTHISYFMIVWF